MSKPKSLNDLVRVIKNGRAIQVTRRNAENPNFMRENECVLAEVEDFSGIVGGIELPVGVPVDDSEDFSDAEQRAIPEPRPEKAKPGPKPKTK